MGMPMVDTGPHYERRRMLDRVMAIHDACNAVAAAGSEELKQRMGELIAAIKETADVAVDKKTTELALAREVVELAATVNKIVNGWSADPAAAEGEAEDDELAGDV